MLLASPKCRTFHELIMNGRVWLRTPLPTPFEIGHLSREYELLSRGRWPEWPAFDRMLVSHDSESWRKSERERERDKQTKGSGEITRLNSFLCTWKCLCMSLTRPFHRIQLYIQSIYVILCHCSSMSISFLNPRISKANSFCRAQARSPAPQALSRPKKWLASRTVDPLIYFGQGLRPSESRPACLV